MHPTLSKPGRKMHQVCGQTLYSKKIDKESQQCISAVCQYLRDSSGPKYRQRIYFITLPSTAIRQLLC